MSRPALCLSKARSQNNPTTGAAATQGHELLSRIVSLSETRGRWCPGGDQREAFKVAAFDPQSGEETLQQQDLPCSLSPLRLDLVQASATTFLT